MSSPWSYLPATEKQINAIAEYEEFWEINICIKSKQDAHDVISSFIKNDRELILLDNGTIKDTNIKWTKDLSKALPKELIRVRTDKKKYINTLDLLQEVARYNDILDENPSMSEEEDKLGFLSPEELDHYNELMGNNPYSVIE